MNADDIVYTRQAEEDLDSIFEYISENSMANALAQIRKIQSAIENLLEFPYLGINCRSKGIKRDCRILIFEKYLIFYQVEKDDDNIKILRILHGARKYQDLF